MRIGIMGYGNLGRGIECAIKQNPDMELAAVFSRRDPSTVSILTEGVKVYSVDEADENIDEDDYGYTVICVRGELPKGKYTVIFEKPGYVTLSEEILIEKNANNYEFTPICGDIRGSYEEHLGDGKVDFDDFIRVLRGINENSSELLRLAVDLNEDGIVNVNDLAIIKASIATE